MKTLPAGTLEGTLHGRQGWICKKLENDTTIEDILKPGFYAHYASEPAHIKQFARIELVTKDGMLYADLLVTKVERGLVFVRPLIISEAKGRDLVLKELAEPTVVADADPLPDVPDGYKCGFAPGNKLWYVQLKEPATMLATGLSKRKAHEFAIEHAKKAGALVDA